MAEVIDISSKLERWIEAYSRAGGSVLAEFDVKVSNHGRLMITIGRDNAVLSCTQMVQLIQGIIQAMSEQGFPQEPEPPPPADQQFLKGR